MTAVKYSIMWGSIPIPLLLNVGIEKKIFPQQLYHIPDEVLHAYYDAARDLYQEHNFQDASDAFAFLSFLNPMYTEIWFGLGLAEHNLGKYEPASVAYEAAAILSPNNPQIYANLYKCYKELNMLEQANNSFQKCLDLCGDNPEFNEVKSDLIKNKQ